MLYSKHTENMLSTIILIPISLHLCAGAVGGDGGDDGDDKEKAEEEERERQEAIREAEERRKEKHRKMEEEREKMRQDIRDKVRTCDAIRLRSRPSVTRVFLPQFKLTLVGSPFTSDSLTESD